MTHSTEKYTPYNNPTCVLVFNTSDGSDTTQGVTMSVSGGAWDDPSFDPVVLTVAALSFNQLTIDTASWTVSKTIEITMENNSSVALRSNSISIVVVPCEITASIIPDMTVNIGN